MFCKSVYAMECKIWDISQIDFSEYIMGRLYTKVVL